VLPSASAEPREGRSSSSEADLPDYSTAATMGSTAATDDRLVRCLPAAVGLPLQLREVLFV